MLIESKPNLRWGLLSVLERDQKWKNVSVNEETSAGLAGMCEAYSVPVRQQTMTAKHYNSEQQSFFLIDKCIHTKTLGLSANCTLVQKCVSVSENVSVIWGKL